MEALGGCVSSVSGITLVSVWVIGHVVCVCVGYQCHHWLGNG